MANILAILSVYILAVSATRTRQMTRFGKSYVEKNAITHAQLDEMVTNLKLGIDQLKPRLSNENLHLLDSYEKLAEIHGEWGSLKLDLESCFVRLEMCEKFEGRQDQYRFRERLEKLTNCMKNLRSTFLASVKKLETSQEEEQIDNAIDQIQLGDIDKAAETVKSLSNLEFRMGNIVDKALADETEAMRVCQNLVRFVDSIEPYVKVCTIDSIVIRVMGMLEESQIMNEHWSNCLFQIGNQVTAIENRSPQSYQENAKVKAYLFGARRQLPQAVRLLTTPTRSIPTHNHSENTNEESERTFIHITRDKSECPFDTEEEKFNFLNSDKIGEYNKWEVQWVSTKVGNMLIRLMDQPTGTFLSAEYENGPRSERVFLSTPQSHHNRHNDGGTKALWTPRLVSGDQVSFRHYLTNGYLHHRFFDVCYEYSLDVSSNNLEPTGFYVHD